MRHPTAFDLDRWARSFADPGLRALAQHVLACVECRQRALRALATAPGRGRGISPVEPGELDEALIDSFERVRDRALACVGGERLRVDALYAELVSHPPARRELLVANSSRYGSALLARRVLEASRDSCHGDAAASESLARLALAILERADVAVYGARLLADLAGRAWSFLGNARRAANDLAGAETAFGRAGAELAATGDPLERAGYYRRLASLRRDQCRFAEARELLAGAADLYAEIGDEERRGRTLCGLGLALLEEERAGAAIEPLVEALTMVDPLADPRSR